MFYSPSTKKKMICARIKQNTCPYIEMAGRDDLFPVMRFYHWHIPYDAYNKRKRSGEHKATPDLRLGGTKPPLTPDVRNIKNTLLRKTQRWRVIDPEKLNDHTEK